MHGLQHLWSRTLLSYVLYIIKVSTDYTKEASNTDDQYVPYILPTEFSLEDLLQSSQYFSKFHCIRLKKDSEIVGKADISNISNEL